MVLLASHSICWPQASRASRPPVALLSSSHLAPTLSFSSSWASPAPQSPVTLKPLFGTYSLSLVLLFSLGLLHQHSLGLPLLLNPSPHPSVLSWFCPVCCHVQFTPFSVCSGLLQMPLAVQKPSCQPYTGAVMSSVYTGSKELSHFLVLTLGSADDGILTPC